MNDIKNINLGGFPFAIDMEAYNTLEDYLDTIDSHFSHAQGKAEIVSDIEARIAEIFRDRPASLEIVVLKDVHHAISIMGTPEDFGATSSFDADDYDDIPKSEWVFGRKMMRDPDDKIVGGVCSGLAAYFGIDDPIWTRLIMGTLIFGMGIGFGLYIVLWIAMPEAKTASDRLAMRGEDINVENISREMERGFESFSESMNRFGEKMNEFGEKMAGKK